MFIGTAVKLTTQERILLHLLEKSGRADRFTVPASQTQGGISESAWFHARHAAEYLRPLLADGTLRERTAHVEGSRQRRKVYELTDSGRAAAIRLRIGLLKEPVRVRDAATIRVTTIGELVANLEPAPRLLDILRQLVHHGVFEPEIASRPVGRSLVAMLADAPRVDGFLGRDRELEAIQREHDRAPLVVVLGLAGIGKSWLAARACDALRETHSVFWHRVQPWDSVASLLADVARFLGALGRPGLAGALAKGSQDQAIQVLREDLPGTHSVLIFDDAHEGPSSTMPFFRLLKDSVAHASDVRAVVLTRRALPFYDRRDVAVSHTVIEIELGGLRPEEVATRLPPEDAAIAEELGRRVGGHPLYLDLARRQPKASLAMHDFRRFLEEEVYEGLTEAQATMMKLASVYRVAVPREAMFGGPSLNHDVLLSLTNRALIRRVGEDRFAVHDTVRDFFASTLTPAERRALAAFAVTELRSLSERSLRAGNAVAARAALSNALDLPMKGAERVAALEALGEATKRMGDLSGALDAYRKALELRPDRETRARLHRRSAEVYEEGGDVSAARLELDSALSSLGDAVTEERGWAQMVRSVVARDAEELDDARAQAAEALRVFETLQVPRGKAEALLELAYAEYISPDGDPAVAERHLRDALVLAERIDDPSFLAKVHIVLANVLAYEGRPDAGLEHLAGVSSMPAFRSDPSIRKSYFEMRGVICMLQDAAEAEKALTEAFSLARDMRDRTTEATSGFGFGWLAFYGFRIDEARARIDEAARIFRDQGMAGHAVEVRFYSALCALLQGDLKAFATILAWIEEPALARGRDSRYPRVWALRGIERLLLGDGAAARTAFSKALRSGRMQWACMTNLLYGVVLTVMGEKREARGVLDRAGDLARRYRWTLPLAGMPAIEARLREVLRHATKAPGAAARRRRASPRAS